MAADNSSSKADNAGILLTQFITTQDSICSFHHSLFRSIVHLSCGWPPAANFVGADKGRVLRTGLIDSTFFIQEVLNSILAGRAVGVEWESKISLLIREVWYEYQNKYR